VLARFERASTGARFPETFEQSLELRDATIGWQLRKEAPPADRLRHRAGEAAGEIELAARRQRAKNVAIARERALQRDDGGALCLQSLRRVGAGEKLLGLAHRDGRRAQIALTAIREPSLLELGRLLGLDLLVFDLTAEHEHELRPDHALLDRQLARRFAERAGRHRFSPLMEPIGLDDQHL